MNINDLPLEMFDHIIKKLNFNDILVAMSVSNEWKYKILNSTIWSEVSLLYQVESQNYSEIMEKFSTHPYVIKHMLIRGIDSKQSTESMLSTFTNLNTIKLIMCKIDADTMQLLNEITSLTTLHIVSCYRFGRVSEIGKWDLDFSKFPKLKSLCLSNFGLRNKNYNTLLGCKDLHDLDVKKIKGISPQNIIDLIAHFKDKCTSLSVYGDEVNDQVLEYISECRNLTTLCILRCEKITDKGIIFIKKLNLVKLLLWNNSNWTEKGLEKLFADGSLVNLKRLSFSKIEHLSTALVNVISIKCPNLIFFGLYMCPILEMEMLTEEALHSLFPKAKLFYVNHDNFDL